MAPCVIEALSQMLSYRVLLNPTFGFPAYYELTACELRVMHNVHPQHEAPEHCRICYMYAA